MRNASAPGKKPFLPPGSKKWVIGGAAVLALGAIIFAAAALSAPSSSQPTLPVVSTADQGAALVRQAQTAAESGQTTVALTLVKKALSVDPGNTAAQQLVDKLTPKTQTASETPPPDTKNNTRTPDVNAGFDKPVSDLKKLLPTSVSGFRRSMYQVSKTDAQVPFDPKIASTAVSVVLFSVHDRASRTGANDFVNKVVKVAFSKNGSSVTVSGVPAYFGMNGHVGEIGFARGRFAFEVAVTGGSVTPTQLRSIALALASRVPTRTP